MPTKGFVRTVDARNNFGDIINRVAFGKERISLTRRNKPLVAIVPIEDMEILEEIERIKDIEDARAALKEAKEKGTISLDALRRELGL
ncbi:MAG: type II toxin-antitoxin system Phd/YefM family antitoxin [Thermodesulfobacteriota bacterium]|nr:type II toxin-antitoxin system Phd/YefM family antitoxin [Thermodesulfobacteriota bacterium]